MQEAIGSLLPWIVAYTDLFRLSDRWGLAECDHVWPVQPLPFVRSRRQGAIGSVLTGPSLTGRGQPPVPVPVDRFPAEPLQYFTEAGIQLGA